MDELDKIREAMAAAVRKLGGRPSHIRVVADPTKLDVTPDELAEFENSVHEAAIWIRNRVQTSGSDPTVELLAIASALGAVAAWDYQRSMELALMLAQRLVTAAEQVKEQP